jgi:hypothetical protein
MLLSRFGALAGFAGPLASAGVGAPLADGAAEMAYAGALTIVGGAGFAFALAAGSKATPSVTGTTPFLAAAGKGEAACSS